AVASCGLVWDPEKARRCFDASCVHHGSAIVAHESQRLYDALAGSVETAAAYPIGNPATTEAEAFTRESPYREIGERDRDEIDALRRQADDLRRQADDLRRQADELQTRLTQADETLQHLRSMLMQAEERARNDHDKWHHTLGRLELAREELGR